MVAAFLPLTLETQSHSNLHVHTTVAEPHGCLDAYIFIASRPRISTTTRIHVFSRTWPSSYAAKDQPDGGCQGVANLRLLHSQQRPGYDIRLLVVCVVNRSSGVSFQLHVL